MKFAITGATGFVGKKLVHSLLSQQHEVRVLSRNPTNAAKLFGNAVEAVEWDPDKSESHPSILEGVHAVIHLAGEGIADKRWSPTQKKKIYDSRVLGTRNIVSTLRKMGTSAPKTFVSASAIGFYGDRGDQVLDENSLS